MLKSLVLAVLAFIMICSASSSQAAEYQRRLVDGHVFGATVFGPQGAEPAVVAFQRDEARVQLLDGESLMIVLYNRNLDDLHFVTGKGLDGRFYRLDLNESAWLYGSGFDPFFMPYAPNNIGGRPPWAGPHHGHRAGD